MILEYADDYIMQALSRKQIHVKQFANYAFISGSYYNSKPIFNGNIMSLLGYSVYFYFSTLILLGKNVHAIF